MMSDQNPHPGDIRHSQIPLGCPTPPPSPPSGLTLIGALAKHLIPIFYTPQYNLIFLCHKTYFFIRIYSEFVARTKRRKNDCLFVCTSSQHLHCFFVWFAISSHWHNDFNVFRGCNFTWVTMCPRIFHAQFTNQLKLVHWKVDIT